MTRMRPRTALAIALLAVGIAVVSSAGAAAVEDAGSAALASGSPTSGGEWAAEYAGGPNATAAQAANGNESGGADSPGAVLSGTVGGEQSTLDAEVRTGTVEYRLAAVDPAARGAVLAELAAELSASLARVDERFDAAESTTDRGRRRYLAARATVERESVERLADSGARFVEALSDERWGTDLRERFRRVANDSRDVDVPDRRPASSGDLPGLPDDAPFVIGPSSNATATDFEEYLRDPETAFDDPENVETPEHWDPDYETPTPPEPPTPTTPTPPEDWTEETATEWEQNETDS